MTGNGKYYETLGSLKRKNNYNDYNPLITSYSVKSGISFNKYFTIKSNTMRIKLSFIYAFILFTMSCVNKTETSKTSEFDIKAATEIIEQRNKEFEDALKIGDSIAVGDIYTLDTKIIGAYAGRHNIIKEVYEMTRDSINGIKFRIINLWGDDKIIVEDAYVEFFHSNGTTISKGECLLVWKKEKDTWRIFRDVYKPEKK